MERGSRMAKQSREGGVPGQREARGAQGQHRQSRRLGPQERLSSVG